MAQTASLDAVPAEVNSSPSTHTVCAWQEEALVAVLKVPLPQAVQTRSADADPAVET